MKRFSFIFFFLPSLAIAQERVLTFGIQYKPIVPVNYFTTNTSVLQNGVDFTIKQKFGFSGGMVIRKGFSKRWSLEAGINLVKRNFEITITDESSAFTGTSKFSSMSYELPVLGLLYIQLSDEIYMNTAFGFSIDFFPSDIGSEDVFYDHYSLRKSWVQPSLLANVGYEFRTKKRGYFYLGISFHRPFFSIYYSNVEYLENGKELEEIDTELKGDYLTLDLRYFFHEDPEKKTAKKKKKTGKTIKDYQKMQKEREKQEKGK